ncbi:MAG: hypothetical protein ACLQUY_09690 [Ktedonobacterales bacterium]
MTRLSHKYLRSPAGWLTAGLCSLLVAGEVGGCGAPSSSGLSPSPLTSYSCAATSTAAAGTPKPPQTPLSGSTHQTYQLTLLILPLQEIFNPGNTLKIKWCPVPGPLTTDTQPWLEVLSVHLIGPYPSKAAAGAAELASALTPPPAPFQPRAPSGPMVATTTPIHTNDWADSVQTATLALPSTLKTGYYIVWSEDEATPPPISAGGAVGSGGGGRIIAVTNLPSLP